MWRRGGRGEDLQLSYLLPWWEWPEGCPGMLGGIGPRDEVISGDGISFPLFQSTFSRGWLISPPPHCPAIPSYVHIPLIYFFSVQG